MTDRKLRLPSHCRYCDSPQRALVDDDGDPGAIYTCGSSTALCIDGVWYSRPMPGCVNALRRALDFEAVSE